MDADGGQSSGLIGALLAVGNPMVSRGEAPSGHGGKGSVCDTKARQGVDVAELFSPPRVTEMARKYGLKPGEAFDLTTGWDFNQAQDRDRARDILTSTKPKLLIGSPECTMFSGLQNMKAWSTVKQRKLDTARQHLRFVCGLYKEQMERG